MMLKELFVDASYIILVVAVSTGLMSVFGG